MQTDLLTLLAVLLSVLPLFVPSARALALVVIVDIVLLILIGKAILAVPSFSYAPTAAVVLVLIALIFLFSCVVGVVLLAVSSIRRARAVRVKGDEPSPTA